VVLSVATRANIQNSWIGRGLQASRTTRLAAEGRACRPAVSCWLRHLRRADCPPPAPRRDCTCNTPDPCQRSNLNYSVAGARDVAVGGTAHWAGPIIGAILLSTTQQLLTVTICRRHVLLLGLRMVLFVVGAPWRASSACPQGSAANRNEGDRMMLPNPGTWLRDQSYQAFRRLHPRLTMSASKFVEGAFRPAGPNARERRADQLVFPGSVPYRARHLDVATRHQAACSRICARRGIARSFQIPRRSGA